MEQALLQFFKLNKNLPERIIVYRDGVGDGMLAAVVRSFVRLVSMKNVSIFLFIYLLSIFLLLPGIFFLVLFFFWGGE